MPCLAAVFDVLKNPQRLALEHLSKKQKTKQTKNKKQPVAPVLLMVETH